MDTRPVTGDPVPVDRRWLEFAADQIRHLPPLADDEDDPADGWREQRWAHIPNRFRWARLDDVHDDDLVTEITTWAATEGPLPNLVLFGPTGTGKTFAAVAAARVRFDAGDEVQFWPIVELLDAIRPNGDPDAWNAAVYDAQVLILDDLGAARATDWTDERLYALVNRRWLDERPTIVTTNLHPRDLATNIGDRMASRVLGGAMVYGLGGQDHRFA